MDSEQALLAALAADPSDELAWRALADWLEEAGRLPEAQLLRLHRRLLAAPEGSDKLNLTLQIAELLAQGARPAGPGLTNSLGTTFALIPPGRFLMGAAEDEEEADPDEQPRHPVEITRPFWLCVHQVTQAQYEQVMGQNPSSFGPQGDADTEGLDTSRFPVENVTWQ